MRFTFRGEQRITSQPPSETHDIASTSATAVSGKAIHVSEVLESSGSTRQTSKPHSTSHATTNVVSADVLGLTNLEPVEPPFPVASGRVSLANMVFSESASGDAEESCGSLNVASEVGVPQGCREIDGRKPLNIAAEQHGRTWKPLPKMTGVTEIESLTKDASRILAEVMSSQDFTSSTALGGERTRGRGIRSPPRKDNRMVPIMSSEFAVLDESDVTNFHQMIPELAINFPFELDTFQKRAVMCLERREDVFVAAHTSAGKTVVAEYAVALAAQSAGRVCYTSPIKSLSNQKFRDFSKKFESVGIVTGDVSIRQESQCLIMTTEILRSMLYRSDDMLRCVDWVVFDETQYLNDPERGVVWETCILMLPPHVRMIMLSATVPNALEFAAWVGRTKQRRVSVVMTDNRPVPLEHALLHVDLTPSAMQTNVQGDRPLTTTVLLRQGGRFLHENFAAAVRDTSSDERGSSSATDGTPASPRSTGFVRWNSDKRRTQDGATGGRGRDIAQPRGRGSGRVSSSMDGITRATGMATGPEGSGTRGDRGRRDRGGRGARGRGGRGGYRRGFGEGRGGGGSWKSSAGYGTLSWIPVVRYLERQLLAPAIIFCFSKRKCAKAVDSLASVDLLPAAKDKARAHRIFENAMLKLQETDRNLPQVLAVREHLKKGIAAHHAGLLPIIKEVTEILFSEGLIKVLFATETFAMGVNFPAKSVVFVGVRKHDGQSFRFLQAGEYTQMSGRAGRRGLDAVGKVFLYFPPDESLPQVGDLRNILTGAPLTLKSAFRLTYNMILNILRVDELRVEDMMRRSFSEAAEELTFENIKEAVTRADEALDKLDEMFEHHVDERALQKYASSLVRVIDLTQLILPKLLAKPRLFKASFSPGRLVLVHRRGLNLAVLGVVFSSLVGSRPRETDRVRTILLHSCLFPASGQTVESVFVEPYRSARSRGDGNSRDNARNRTEFPFFESHGWKFEACDTMVRDILWFGNDRMNTPPIATTQGELNSSFLESSYVREATRFLIGKGEMLCHLSHGPRDASSLVVEDVPIESPCGSESQVSSGIRGNDSMIRSFDAMTAISGTHDSELITSYWAERDDLVASLTNGDRLGCDVARALWSIPRGRHGSMRVRHLSAYVKREKVRSQVACLRATASARSMPDLLPEYRNRVKVLQKMQYVDADGLSVLLKGRSGACEVATVDSVLLTEIILENTLSGLEAAEVASLLSSLVCRVKNKKVAGVVGGPATGHGRTNKAMGNAGTGGPRGCRDGGEGRLSWRTRSGSSPKSAEAEMGETSSRPDASANDVPDAAVESVPSDEIKTELSLPAPKPVHYSFSEQYLSAKEQMRGVVRRFGAMQESCGVDLEFEIGDGGVDYEDAMCRWGMAEVVLAWARGAPFAEVTTLTDEQEGDVVVTVKRLAELLKDGMNVARAVGFEALLETLEDASDAIRRDVIFSGSLYIE